MENTSYTVTLTKAENLALSRIAYSQQEWIDNAVHERCRLAIDDIVHLTVENCLNQNITLPNSKDAMVELAFEQGWVTAAADKGHE